MKRGLFGRAIAIEPEPLNYSLLRTNVELNRVSAQIATHNIALGEKNDETLAFELSKINFGNHRVCYGSDDTDPGQESIEVPSQSLDWVAAEGVNLGSALQWMDAQGFEGYVLAGGTRTLQRKPPLSLSSGPVDCRAAAAWSESGIHCRWPATRHSAISTSGVTRSLVLGRGARPPRYPAGIG